MFGNIFLFVSYLFMNIYYVTKSKLYEHNAKYHSCEKNSKMYIS